LMPGSISSQNSTVFQIRTSLPGACMLCCSWARGTRCASGPGGLLPRGTASGAGTAS
jgi:hypothetical protein